MQAAQPTLVNMGQGITLLSGAMMNYLKPEESTCTIDDIATALSNVCRFSGHLPRFYSVAQHAVNTSRIVDEEHAFTALMHDTAEAFTNDLPTPLKVALPIFKDLEVAIETAMSNRFGFQYPLPDPVKLADSQMLLLEKTYVKEDKNHWTAFDGIEFEHLSHLVDLNSWQPRRAKREFLERFEELYNATV